VHRDADGHDPGGVVAADLGQQLAVFDGHPVVPVQAIEAWCFCSLRRSRRFGLAPGRASCRVNLGTSNSSIVRKSAPAGYTGQACAGVRGI
jgi:hypothetical protein